MQQNLINSNNTTFAEYVELELTRLGTANTSNSSNSNQSKPYTPDVKSLVASNKHNEMAYWIPTQGKLCLINTKQMRKSFQEQQKQQQQQQQSTAASQFCHVCKLFFCNFCTRTMCFL